MSSVLDQIEASFPSLAGDVETLRELHRKKLWHQLTELLDKFIRKPEIAQEEVLMQLYEDFIHTFEAKMNKLKLAEFVVFITRQMTDAEKASEFIRSIISKVETSNREAYILLRAELAHWILRTDKVLEARAILEDCKSLLDETFGIDNTVYSNYYRRNAEFLKCTGKASEFYKDSLLFLAYTQEENLGEIEKRDIAYDIGLSALLGETTYNFGELLSQPIISSLVGTEYEWLYRLLFAFNSGDISEYESICNRYADQLASEIVENKSELKEKIQLMSLVELIFQKSSEDRSLSFEEISNFTRVPLDNVEFLLLKALALELITGIIDEVSQNISVEWVRPRVLTKPQIAMLEEKFTKWIENVEETQKFLENESPELLMS